MWLRKIAGDHQLDLLGLCANYEVKGKNGYSRGQKDPCVVFFQEHRMAVPAIWAAIEDGLFEHPPLMVRIDAHTDYAEERHVNYKTKRDAITNIEDCILFANALWVDDGGWVEAVMKFGWVEHVICLYVQESEWRFNSEIEDVDGKTHEFDVYPDIADRPPDLGCGPVDLRPDPLTNLILSVSNPETAPPIWLDLDLDFAVENVRGPDSKVLGVSELEQRLHRPVDCVPMPAPLLARDVVANLFSAAKLITIASEPEFSGGFIGVERILDALRLTLPEHNYAFNWFKR